MGAIFAILGNESEEALERRLQPMLNRSSYRGEPQTLRVPGAVLAIQSLGWDASMAKDEHNVICFHGFIGNWSELEATHKAIARPGSSEADRVARAYGILGDKLFDLLRGEFSILIYHRADRSIKAVRDVIGARPLYYQLVQGLTFLASEIRQVSAGSGARRELNNNACAARLLNSYYNVTDTLFEGVFRVAPAEIHGFLAGGTNPTRTPYWELAKTPPKSGANYGDLAEEALHHIERAMRRYLPQEPYAFSLGGGLDSGAMWSILGKWSLEGDSNLQRARACSMIHPGMSCNEEDMIRQHMDLYPADYRLLDASNLLPSMFRSRMLASLDHVPTSSAYQLFWFAEQIQNDFTCRHEITGIGGDELFGGTLDYLTDELLTGHATTVLQDLFTLQMPGQRSRYQIIRNHLIKPCIHRLGLHPGPWKKPAWLGTQFTNVHKVIEERASKPRLATRAQEVFAGTLETHQAGMILEPREQILAMYGIAPRTPLLDRDLIEFAQALPPRACWQGHQYKTLLRNAIRSIAPAALTMRTAKTFFNEPYARDRVQLDADLRNPEAWRLVQKGMLDLEGIRQFIASHRTNQGQIRNVDFLHRLLHSESFCTIV